MGEVVITVCVHVCVSLKWKAELVLGNRSFWMSSLSLSLIYPSLSLTYPSSLASHYLSLYYSSTSFPLYRAKLYKLQHPGKELVFSDMKPPVSETEQQGKLIWCAGRKEKGMRERKGEKLYQSFISQSPHTGQMDMSTVTQQKEESRKILRE